MYKQYASCKLFFIHIVILNNYVFIKLEAKLKAAFEHRYKIAPEGQIEHKV